MASLVGANAMYDVMVLQGFNRSGNGGTRHATCSCQLFIRIVGVQADSIQHCLFGLRKLRCVGTLYSIIYSIIIVSHQSEQVELRCYYAVCNEIHKDLWTDMCCFE